MSLTLWRCLATCALCLGTIFAHAKPIKLRNQVTDPVADAPARQADSSTRNGLFIIQLTGPMQAKWRDDLLKLGVEPLRHIPDDAFIARVKNVPQGQVRKLPFVRWLGPYRPDHKIHRPLQQAHAPSVSVLLAPGAAANEINSVRQSFTKAHESRRRFGHMLRGQLRPGQLQALAQSHAVLWIEAAPAMKLFDEVSADIVAGEGNPRTTAIHELGYDGSGVTIAVADSGLHTGNAPGMHPDLAGRVDAFFYYGDLLDASDEHSHGTHVAGIIAGSGVIGETDELGNLYGLGVAPGAHIVAQRIFDGVGIYQPPGSFEQLTRDAVSSGADIGSNSWGDDTQGRYDISAAEFDALVRDADSLTPGDQQYILEFSAGNAGPGTQTIGSPAVAKNVIATGAAQNNRFDFFIYAEGQETMADFSSRGPCEDGRIKPDIVAPGTWIASLRSAFADDENAWAPISFNYLYQGGTSQSGPHVSGAAAIFVQYYREHYGATPSPALVKAALLNSAVDMYEGEGGTDAIPNNDEGWGRLDLTELIDSPRAYQFLDQSILLGVDQAHERRVVLASPEPLKITLTYTDVPGFPGAIPALVNDLDLEVVAPDGRIYRGNQFNQGESIPNASAADAINNVEGVHLFEPEPGEYLIRVRARNVPEDARLDTPAIDQDFALVISADLLPPGIGAIFMDRPAYTAPGRIKITVVDTDLAGSSSVTVNIRSTAEPAGENVVLLAAGSGGTFTNSISTTTAAVNGQLQIAHGNTITATYQDVSAGATRTANALADLQGPVISNVSVTNRFGRPVIQWNTDEVADGRVLFGTNASLGQFASDSSFDFDHEISLAGLVPGRTYFYRVASTDRAGNASTNATVQSFVAPAGRTVLLVDAFHGDFFFDPPPPISNYTAPLDTLGVDYELWDTSIDGSPALADLQPFRTVIWRLPELKFPNGTFTPGERTAISNYLNGGGSLFVASMEVLSRLDEAEPPRSGFGINVLQVPSFTTDATLPAIDGIPGDPITDGLTFELDFTIEYGDSQFDFSDTIVPGTNAAGIFFDPFGDFAGLRYPRPGVQSAGRVVFLPFPFDAIPPGGTAPNTRTELLRRILNFLAPGLGGAGTVALDKGNYTLPSVVTVEIADSDLAGSGQATVTASNQRTGNSVQLSLNETIPLGAFRGTFTLGSGTGDLSALHGDRIIVSYLDASRGQAVTAGATVDTAPPAISGTAHEADYVEAFIFWETSEPADALVQFGESPLLGRSAYAFELDIFHEIRLLGLQPDQTYYYRVVSRDEAGNTVVDDNGGNLYTFRTLRPIVPPWADHLDSGATNWTVIDGEETFSTWTLGVPDNGWETSANSPPNAWGSNLDGGVLDSAETFLVSPAISLTGGNRATLRFWHSYDFTEKSEFDIIELGRVLIITNTLTEPVELLSIIDDASGWLEEEIDLTPYVGHLIYIAFHYVILSFDNFPRAGWLLDDVSITMNTVTPGLVTVTNNLFQARFALSGQMSRAAGGKSYQVTNAPPGVYNITYTAVPFYTTPAPQSATLNSGGVIGFVGNYTFADANSNGMSDAWETNHFGAVSPSRTATTDTDGDGITDLQEFRAGTNPNSASSRFVLATPVLLPDGRLRLQWPTTPGRGYRLEGSANGVGWSPLTSWLVAPGTLLTHDAPPWSPGAPYLFRVEVQP